MADYKLPVVVRAVSGTCKISSYDATTINDRQLGRSCGRTAGFWLTFELFVQTRDFFHGGETLQSWHQQWSTLPRSLSQSIFLKNSWSNLQAGQRRGSCYTAPIEKPFSSCKLNLFLLPVAQEVSTCVWLSTLDRWSLCLFSCKQSCLTAVHDGSSSGNENRLILMIFTGFFCGATCSFLRYCLYQIRVLWIEDVF